MRAVDMDHDFIGRAAVKRALAEGPARKLVGLVAAEAPDGEAVKIPTQGTGVLAPGGGEVGQVTSATFSEAIGGVIAMAQVSCESCEAGTRLVLDAPHGPLAAAVTELPFRPRAGG